MGAKIVFFDFDETLVDTSELRPYRQTAEGRRFVANHPEQVNTRLTDPDLLALFNKLAKRKLATIATNSAKDYTIALLNKHGFSTDIPIYDNLHKPCHHDLSQAIGNQQCNKADDALYIGDSASDIIAAHGCRMPSVAVTWGKTSTPAKLIKAEPTQIAKTGNELEACIRSFMNGEFTYKERVDPKKYIFLGERQARAEIEFYSFCIYYPTRHPNFNRSSSDKILRFKDLKDFSNNEIRNGATEDYFHEGEVRKGMNLKTNLKQFYNELRDFIYKLDLKGKSYAIAAPNSAPEYCYKFDVNQRIVKKLNQNFEIDSAHLERILFRVFPKRESHVTGSRNESEHYKTIGVKKEPGIPDDVDNLIIFDDVSTTGIQMTCLANIMKNIFEFDGKIIGLSLGKTTDECINTNA